MGATRFRPLDVMELNEKVVSMFGTEWFLLTAGTPDRFNTMTCAWGGIGYLWNQPVCFVFVRPQRHTFEFTEAQDYFTITVYPESCRQILNFCGTHSGRDVDKISQTGLTPVFDDRGAIWFDEARLVMICRKLYRQRLTGEAFTDKKLPPAIYPAEDYHMMYIGAVETVLKAD